MIRTAQSADFVCQMEEVLEVYARTYDPLEPVLCLGEQPQVLHSHAREPLKMQPGTPARQDDEYVRQGTANVFCVFEPLRGWRDMRVTPSRTLGEFADVLKMLCDEVYPTARQIHVVLGNLNIHKKAALYSKFKPSEARRMADKLVFHHTPKHGSWLNAAEIELSIHQVGVVTCYRMPDKEVHCLVQDRNLGVDPIEVTSYRGAYHLITPDGLAIRPFNVAVGSLSKDFGDYNGRRVPSKTFVSTYVMFNLPSDVDYLPVLDVNGVPFRNIPIDASETERLPSTQLGAALLDTRNDDIRGVISGCQCDQAQPEWVKCNSSFKSVDREKHELSASGGVGLTDDGLWAELSLGDAYQITEIPAEGVQNVTLWLKPNHKDISFFSYLEVGGLVFRNVVVKQPPNTKAGRMLRPAHCFGVDQLLMGGCTVRACTSQP